MRNKLRTLHPGPVRNKLRTLHPGHVRNKLRTLHPGPVRNKLRTLHPNAVRNDSAHYGGMRTILFYLVNKRIFVKTGLVIRASNHYHAFLADAGWSSLAARRAHNPKVAGSNPAPATNIYQGSGRTLFFNLPADAGGSATIGWCNEIKLSHPPTGA